MGRVLALCLTQGVPREHTCFIPKPSLRCHPWPERNAGTAHQGRSAESSSFRKEFPYEKLMLICFALALVMSLLALAQEGTKPDEMKPDTMKAEKASAKAVRLNGKI